MAFKYETFVLNKGVSDTREELIKVLLSTDEIYIRTIHIHNTDDSGPVTFEAFLVPNVAGAEGSWSVYSRLLYKELAAQESLLVEFPTPGIVLTQNDKMEFIASVIDRCVLTVSGGRNYA